MKRAVGIWRRHDDRERLFVGFREIVWVKIARLLPFFVDFWLDFRRVVGLEEFWIHPKSVAKSRDFRKIKLLCQRKIPLGDKIAYF